MTMIRYWKPALILAVLLALCLASPLIYTHAAEIKTQLIHFKKYCIANTWTGYAIYCAILFTILMAGLPIASAAMLLAGVIYGFWEAATLVTFCRLFAASLAFVIARQLVHVEPTKRRRQRRKKQPLVLRSLKDHPNMALVVARLMPIPDSVVNYGVAATPIRNRDYLVLSLVGMIPFTLFCVWMGQQLGTVSGFVRFLN